MVGLVVAAAVIGQPAGSASFPRENGSIAFSSTRAGNERIYVMGADGSGPTRLTADTTSTFDNRNLNWTALAEVVLAVLITQMDVLRRMFGTVELSFPQWALALVPAVALLFLWELGKLIARRETTASAGTQMTPD